MHWVYLAKSSLRRIVLPRSILKTADLRLEEQSLMRERLLNAGSQSPRRPLQALGQGIKLRRIRRVVIPVEVQVEDAAGSTDSSCAGRADRALVGRIDVAIAVP